MIGICSEMIRYLIIDLNVAKSLYDISHTTFKFQSMNFTQNLKLIL